MFVLHLLLHHIWQNELPL